MERLGNVTLLERPVRMAALISVTRSAVRARERQYQVRMLNRRKDECLATLAHELRNPLAPIRNAMEIVERLHPSRAGALSLKVQACGPRVDFQVRDSGKGIEAGSLDRIFDMFAQSRAVGEPSAGLGIGLHLAKVFAEMHGGGVTVAATDRGRAASSC